MLKQHLEEMLELSNAKHSDTEVSHVEADKILCRVVYELGADGRELVELFRNLDKWYA